MCVMDDNDDLPDDWRALMMSPTGLLSGLSSDPFSKSVSNVCSGGGSAMGTDHVFMLNPEANLGEDGFRVVENAPVSNGDLMMEKYGFNDSSHIISSGSGLRRLTIPSGMSPNELLDSPVMLPNSQLSPTTGTMNLSPLENENSMLKSTSISSDREHDGDDVSSYELKPPWPGPPSQNHNFDTEDYYKSLHPVQPLADYEFLVSATDTKTPFSAALMAKTSPFHLSSHSYGEADTEMKESPTPIQVKKEQSLDVVHKQLYSSVGTTKTSEDGFNWRKYGQKQVKGSDYPRSYYKCTHLTCPVKKKVERSHDGDITEIIYKGDHNHPKPIPSRRSTFGSCGDPTTDIVEGLEIQSSTSVVTELSDLHSNNQKPLRTLESPETLELSSTLASHDEEEDTTTTQGRLLDDDMENKAKRRKKESSLMESALGSRALREPRVIVQIESEIDIVDDGYRWRKYGQKVVKGNPNPRSYYKCTSAGCTVRKHVERASDDLKFVLTTYEGKHNHVVPAARNSTNHMNSSNGNLPPSSSTSRPTLTLPRNTHLPKAEPQDFVPSFDRKIEYDNEFLRRDCFGNFSGGSSSMFHQMKFPPLPSSGIYGGFGLNPNYTSSTLPMIPSVGNLSIPLPLNFQLPSSFAMNSYNHHGRTLNPVPPFFMGQQMKDNDIKFIRPKQEQQD